ncbi:hypothetical protein ABK040_014714 [Willaertia magna]
MQKTLASIALKRASIKGLFAKKTSSMISSFSTIYSHSSHYHMNNGFRTINFYDFYAKDLVHNKDISFSNLRGKVTFVTCVNMLNPNAKHYLQELQKLKQKRSNEDFEILVYAIFGKSDNKQNNTLNAIQRFISSCSNDNNVNYNNNVAQMKQIDDLLSDLKILKEKYTDNPYEPNEALEYLQNYRDGFEKNIIEDFEKFIISKEGKLIMRGGNNTKLTEIEENVEKAMHK